MPKLDDVRLWTAWGAPIAFRDEKRWDQPQSTEHKQDGWFYPQQITDFQETIWIRSISRDSVTLSYTPSDQSIHSYHITFPPAFASCFVLHETTLGQHKSDITYEVQKTFNSQLQIKNGCPTTQQKYLVASIFKYQQDRYKQLFGQKYEGDYSATTEEEDGTFKNKFGGSMKPRRDTKLQQLLKYSVQQHVSRQISDISANNDEQPTKKQRKEKEQESTGQSSVDAKLITRFAAIEPEFKLLGKEAKKDTYEYTLPSIPMGASQTEKLIEALEKEGFIGIVTKKTQKDGSIIIEASTDGSAHTALKHLEFDRNRVYHRR